MNQKTEKTALVFGATGLIGGHLLDELFADNSYAKVLTFGRSKVDKSHTKLQQKIVDFDHPESFADQVNGDAIFCCLGTTRKKAGKEGFYKVDFTYCHNAAKMGKENGVPQFLLISSIGADADSMFYYSQVKGEIEDAIRALQFPTTHIFQPSLLLGERGEDRFGESLAQKVMSGLESLAGGILGKYSPIEAKRVAQAMLFASNQEIEGFKVYNSQEIENLGIAEETL